MGFLLYFSEYVSFFSNLHISAKICKNSADLHISAKICKNPADLHRFAKIENLGAASNTYSACAVLYEPHNTAYCINIITRMLIILFSGQIMLSLGLFRQVYYNRPQAAVLNALHCETNLYHQLINTIKTRDLPLYKSTSLLILYLNQL